MVPPFWGDESTLLKEQSETQINFTVFYITQYIPNVQSVLRELSTKLSTFFFSSLSLCIEPHTVLKFGYASHLPHIVVWRLNFIRIT